jgi:hypothetical protein
MSGSIKLTYIGRNIGEFLRILRLHKKCVDVILVAGDQPIIRQ